MQADKKRLESFGYVQEMVAKRSDGPTEYCDDFNSRAEGS
jgi:hypothetical protein